MTVDIDLDAEDITTSLLRQGTYWRIRGIDGQLHQVHLDQLGTDHRHRLLAWLRRNAEVMRAHEARDTAQRYRLGQLTAAEFAAAMRPLEELPAQVWLDDTPLVRRLVQLVPAEPRPPRRRRLLPWRKR